MKACIIGAGVIADLCHLPGYVANGFEVAGMADLDVVRAQQMADKYPVKKLYVDWQEMLEAEKPDVVSVCLPNMLHEAPVIAALRGGAHVLCEKPLAPTVASAEKMFAVASECGRHLMAAQQFRFSSGAAAVRPLVEAGGLGHVYHAEADWLRTLTIPRRRGFHSRSTSGGGPLIDLGVHAIDLALWLMGDPQPVSVSASTARAFGNRPEVVGDLPWSAQEFDVEDFAVAFVRFATGASLIVRTSWAANLNGEDKLSVRLVGTEAGVVTEPPAIHRISNGVPSLETFPALVKTNAWAAEMAHWTEVVKGNVEPLVTAQETLNVLRILEAAYESAERGVEVVIGR